MTLKLALLGAGRIGAVHADAIMTAVPDATLVAVADVHLPAAQAIAERYNVPHVSDQADAILQLPEVDAVVIASATNTHAPFIIAAAGVGKAIFCEKPIAAELALIDEALAAVEQAGVPLQIGFNRRFDPSFQRIKAAIDTGSIGTPHLLHIVSRDPSPPPIDYVKVSGGIFFDMMSHDFDMARYLFGDVEAVYAAGGVLVDPAIGAAGDIDTAVVLLHFASGALGTIDNSRQAVYGYDQRVEAFGSAGSASNANLYPDAVTLHSAQRVERASLPLNFFIERYRASYIAELQAFVAAVRAGDPVPVTGDDGRVPVVMAAAAQRSYDLGRPVRLDEIEA